MASPTADLIRALAAPGADAAWSALAQRHGADVWRLVNSRLRDAHAAEDAYQEFWLALPAAAQRFRPDPIDTERKARAWLMHIAYTTAIAQHRQRRPDAVPVDDAPCPREAEMDQRDQRAEMVERIREAVERLPESHRRPLLLHVVGGLSYEDLATDLRCTVNNARVKVHRGLAALRGMLGAEGGRLTEQALAGALVPPLLLAPPPLPPAMPALPPPPPPGVLALVAKAPLLTATAVAGVATATVATAVIVSSPSKPQEPPVSPIRTLAAATAATATLAAAASGDDFDRDAAGITSPDPSVTISMVPSPKGAGSGKAMKVAWTGDHKPFIQWSYADFRPAPEITADGGTVTVAVWIEAMSGVKGLSVRLVDANWETFQWAAPLPNPEQSGWRTVTIAIDPKNHKGNWGPEGKVDGVIDWPVKLGGFAFDFTEKAPSGSILFDNIVTAAAKP